MIGIFGVKKITGGFKTLTFQFHKLLSEMEIPHEVVGISEWYKFHRLKRCNKVLLISHWYYNAFLLYDFLEKLRYHGVKLYAYMVTEGKIPNSPSVRKLFKLFELIFVPSKYCYNEISKFHDCKLVPHGIDVDLFKDYGIERKYDIFMLFPSKVSRINMVRKSYDIMLKIAELFSNDYKIVTNIFAKEYGINNVKIIDIYSRDILAKVYNESKIFIFPSRIEGFGIPPLEAMACGCLCIFSDVPAHNEFGVGIKVKPVKVYEYIPDDAPCPYEFYETRVIDYVVAIKEALENYNKYKGLIEKAKEVASKYNYKELYKEILEEMGVI